MYSIHFKKPSRALIKNFKELKQKNGHTIHEAEDLIASIQNNINEDLKVTLIAKEIEGEKSLEFDPITLSPKGREIFLLNTFIDELLSPEAGSGLDDEDIRSIIEDMNTQYTEEDMVTAKKESTKKKTNKKESVKKKAPKKNGVLSSFTPKLSFGNGKTKKYNKEEVDQNDFEELESLPIKLDPSDTDSMEDDYSEVIAEENLDILNAEDTNNEFVDLPMGDFTEKSIENEIISNETQFPENDSYIYDSYEEEQDKTKEAPLLSENFKETVQFMDYENYVNLNELEPTFKRYKKQFEVNEFLKYLNLPFNYEDSDLSDLDKKKLEYSLGRLRSPEVQVKLQEFNSKLATIIERATLNLGNAHDEILMTDYRVISKDVLEDELISLDDDTEQLISDYIEKEEAIFTNRISAFEANQLKELEAFKRQQESEKNAYVLEQEDRHTSDIELFRQDREKQNELKKAVLVEEQTEKQKLNALNKLRSTKREVIATVEDSLSEGSLRVTESLDTDLAAIRKEITALENPWKAEIDRELRRVREERELDIEEKRVLLQQQEIEMKKQGNVAEVIPLTQEQEQIKELHEKIDRLIPKNTYHNEQFNMENDNIAPPNAAVINQGHPKSNILKNAAIVSLGVALGLLFGSYMMGSNNSAETDSQTTANPVVASANDEINTEETSRDSESSRLEKVEEQLSILSEANTSDSDTEKEDIVREETIGDYLTQKDYVSAIKVAKNQGDYEMIADSMMTNKSLGDLKAFNDSHKTVYGELYETILLNDLENTVKLVESMDKNIIQAMTGDKKKELALVLYQTGANDLAKSVLEENIKK